MTEPSGHLLLLVTSPRVAPGLLSWPAWQALRDADLVLADGPDPARDIALGTAGVRVEVDVADNTAADNTAADSTDAADADPGARGRRLVDAAAAGRRVVWWGSADGDPRLTDAVAVELSRRTPVGEAPGIEVLVGSHDVPGARLLDLVAVMDRLRSPGGCPWDAEQTHASLRRYLLEETHELLEAIDGADRTALREELGDVLLQVVFHARLAAESTDEPFDVDDVAAGIVTKLVNRHPHVFAPVSAEARTTAGDVEQSWHQLKAAEKGRASVLDGVPLALPALARAQKILDRIERAGLATATEAASTASTASTAQDHPTGQPLDEELLALVHRARAEGAWAEDVLRERVRRLETEVRASDTG